VKKKTTSNLILIAALTAVAPLASGCDEYEREQIRQAGDDIGAAGTHIGNASDSAIGRARDNTADALRNLSNQIDTHNQKIDESVDRIDQN
tara:strand:- start:3084 stop:3356 length:273 start_codon:yes stop_codon:yes gene_type:complete